MNVRLVTAALLPAVLLAAPLKMPRAEYEDRVRAAWLGQIAGALMGFEFEHKPAAAAWVDRVPDRFPVAPVDDDWYYEMVAIRAFEKYGIGMTVAQLGEQWKANNAGTWGSSQQTRLLLARGVRPPDTGHPRYNRLWFSIGPQFSGDVYGLVAPGMPNLAARLAREHGHINGYAEGADGGVFVAGMISLAFVETDVREIVRKAARLIHPGSPYRQCLDLVIGMAERGASAAEVAAAVEDRWHVEYPATNNAVANGGLVALSVWFGEGDLLQTLNHGFRAGDFTDADCNAANAAAVVGAMKGTKAFPPALLARLGDRIKGTHLGDVALTPPVDESITELARRTAAVGAQFLAAHPGESSDTQPLSLERFTLADLMQWWNPGWTLERAGFGGAGGGMKGLRGNTYLDGKILATYPRDEVRGVVLRRTLTPAPGAVLSVEVSADPGRAWALDVYAGNERLLTRTIQGGWQTVTVPLAAHAGKPTAIRLFQRVLLGPELQPGNALWRNLKIQ